MLRTITIEIEIPGNPSSVVGGVQVCDPDPKSTGGDGSPSVPASHDEQYENLCHTLWTLGNAVTRITNMRSWIVGDQHATDQQLNGRWDAYTKGGSVVLKPRP